MNKIVISAIPINVFKSNPKKINLAYIILDKPIIKLD